jgi:DMSO/TMAO reductase YedYZ heme-binding membrane subunit
LLLGLWLGAAVFFGAAVAPTVFGVLRGAQLSNAGELAGMMVQRLLSVINRGGFEISLFLLVTGYFVSKRQSRLARSAEMISLAIMAIMTGISHWIISARMLALKAAMQAPIDQIGASDPRRVAFDALHGYSVATMGVAIVAGLIAFLIMARPRAITESAARP